MLRRKIKLKKELGVLQLTILGLTMIIGAGIFALVGEGAKLAGTSVIVSLVFIAFIAFFSALSYAELSSIFPKASSSYIYVRKSLNSKFLSFLVGWCILWELIIGASVVAVAFANYLGTIVSLPYSISSIGIILVFSLITVKGIKESANVNTALGIIEVSTLLVFIICGLAYGNPAALGNIAISSKTLSAAGLLFFAYLGFESMVTCSEETKHARKVVPRAMILAFSICTILYVLVAISLLALLPIQEIGNAPIAEAVASHLGENFSLLLALGSLVAIGDGILAFLVSGSRFIYGVASEGAFPKVLSRVNEKYNTPHLAVILVAILSSLFCFLGENIKLIANVTNFAALFAFFFVNLSVIVLRIRNPQAHREFRIRGSIKNIPITSLLGAISSVILVASLESSSLFLGLIFLAVGVVYYFFFAKGRYF